MVVPGGAGFNPSTASSRGAARRSNDEASGIKAAGIRSSFAPAKVNLYLHVIGRRADGYHLLDSLAVFPAVGDDVAAAPAAELSLQITGPFGGTLRAEPDNLMLRAARLLRPGAGAALTLVKNLPVSSGIGGGSADAAAALRVLAALWDVAATPETALQLGADVPVCLAAAPALMGGIGDILRPPPALPRFGIVLLNPGVPVATAAVFKARAAAFSPPACLPAGWPDAAAMARDLAALRNDLEAPALEIEPAIGRVLAALRALPGVLLARMSGSGATCFALFATAEAAAAAAKSVDHPGWWCWGGGLYEQPPADL